MFQLAKIIIFLKFLEVKDFLNNFAFWSDKFFAANQILSSVKYLKKFKIAQVRWLVDKYKNSNTKIQKQKLQLLEPFFFFFFFLYGNQLSFHWSKIQTVSPTER